MHPIHPYHQAVGRWWNETYEFFDVARRRNKTGQGRGIIFGGDLLLGGGFKHFLFSPLFGEDSQFDEYFSNGLVQPPASFQIFMYSTMGFITLKKSISWENIFCFIFSIRIKESQIQGEEASSLYLSDLHTWMSQEIKLVKG